MDSSKRRKLLVLLAGAAAVSVLPSARAARALARPESEGQAQRPCTDVRTARVDAEADALLPQRATTWIDGLRSRGQRSCRIPSRACNENS